MPPSGEGQQPESPQPHGSEHEQSLFIDVRKFPSEETSGRAYMEVQQAIFKDPHNKLSTFRFQYGRQDNLVWHVLVIGDHPHSVLLEKLQTILAGGEVTPLSDELIQAFAERRKKAQQIAPWVEGHYRQHKKRKK